MSDEKNTEQPKAPKKPVEPDMRTAAEWAVECGHVDETPIEMMGGVPVARGPIDPTKQRGIGGPLDQVLVFAKTKALLGDPEMARELFADPTSGDWAPKKIARERYDEFVKQVLGLTLSGPHGIAKAEKAEASK